MSSIFRQYQETNNTPNRNTFDWSHQWNGTMEFGKIYPCFFQEMMPNSSIQFNNIRESLHFMPMIFPVQTRMRAYVHFFKVRRRTLWKDFQDWYTNNKNALENAYQRPYINFDSDEKLAAMAHTGTLGDYLGMPTVSYGKYANVEELDTTYNRFYLKNSIPGVPFQLVLALPNDAPEISPDSSWQEYLEYLKTLDYEDGDVPPLEEMWLYGTLRSDQIDATNINNLLNKWYALPYLYLSAEELGKLVESDTPYIDVPVNFGGDVNSLDLSTATMFIGYLPDSDSFENGSDNIPVRFQYKSLTPTAYSSLNGKYLRFGFSDIEPELFKYNNRNRKWVAVIAFQPQNSGKVQLIQVGSSSGQPLTFLDAPAQVYYGSEILPDEVTMATSPWYYMNEPTGKRVKVNAEPFRAYEAVYNSFYRNIYNNPYILNGREEYNKFIPTDAGEADNNTYVLHYRNWEDDFLTTALPTPQQGDNPVLVGITPDASGIGTQMALRDENGKVFTIKFNVSDEGDVLESVDYEEAIGNQFQVVNYLNLSATGVSIPDIRNANALQRWLELNARKGLRFKDHIKGHFDVDIRYDELMMPEFIGGFAEDVNVDQVTQTVSRAEGATGSFEDVLGSFAGQAGIFGGSQNEISTFIDEPSYVIGLITIVPVANYSQLLPKYFTNRDVLDEYFPEFANISMQPIMMHEVAPLQVWKDMQNREEDDPKYVDLQSTFGYQRPWYHHLAQVDQVHGKFRTQFRDFLINRVFDEPPRLSKSFLLVDPNQVNDVFSVTTTDDKILGQIWYDCSVKLPIPRNGQPRIEQ